ncbi:MAG: hypothetical protein Ct9H300mP4_17250 [Gammaproteobacteria bacterium]|nr:MAG: hypothetical protein Ct9H300mP4_17250 [Gammaproteobacteria bacterium]
MVIFSINLDWFPATGMEDIIKFYTGWERLLDIAHHLILPPNHTIPILPGSLYTVDASICFGTAWNGLCCYCQG